MSEKPTYDELVQRVRELEGSESRRNKAEEKLRVSQDRLRQLFKNMMSGFALHEIILDDQGQPVDYRFLDVNPAFVKLTGLTRENILGKTVLTVLPNTEKYWIERFCQVAITGEAIEFENFSQELNRHFLVTAYRPAINQFACLFQDITDRKKAEEILFEANLKQQEAIRAGNIGLWDWDLKKNNVHYSKEWKQQIGCEDHEISDDLKEWISRVHPEDIDRTLEVVNRSIAEATKDHKVEFRFRHKDGSYRWILTQGSVLKDKKGNPVRMLGSHIDITDRKIAEREATILKTAVHQAPVGIALADDNIHIYYCNPEGLAIRGGNIDDLVEIPKDAFINWQVHMLNGEAYEVDNLPLVRAIRSGQIIREEFVVKHQNGTNHICDAVACPMVENDKIMGGIVIFRDITDRKKAEESLQQANAELESKTVELEDTNTALKVLLQKRDQENLGLQENIYSNYELMLTPFLSKLKACLGNRSQQNLLDIIETNLQEIVSPFAKKLASPMMSLTSSEIQIATMIKQGYSNKEIATILNSSKRTIDTHRQNIRRKLKLNKEKINLKTYLMNLQNT